MAIILIYAYEFKERKDLKEFLFKEHNTVNKTTINAAKVKQISKNKVLNTQNMDKNPAKVKLNAPSGAHASRKHQGRYYDYRYANKQNIGEAIIEDNIIYIGKSCFENCTNLTTLTLGKTLQEIGNKCFYKCSNLTTVKYLGTTKEFQTIKRGSGWLAFAGTKAIHCTDGILMVNQFK